MADGAAVKGHACLLSIFLLAAALGTSDLAAQSPARPGFTEAEIKAAFISHLLGFISWQDQRLPSIVCVVRADATSRALTSILGAKKGLSAELRVVGSREKSRDCDLLYLNEGTMDLPDWQPQENLLTVGDTAGFAEGGGMVEFQRIANRIGLIINTRALDAAGLTASSRLLSLASVLAPSAAAP